jgi:hypothetical protein
VQVIHNEKNRTNNDVFFNKIIKFPLCDKKHLIASQARKKSIMKSYFSRVKVYETPTFVESVISLLHPGAHQPIAHSETRGEERQGFYAKIDGKTEAIDFNSNGMVYVQFT